MIIDNEILDALTEQPQESGARHSPPGVQRWQVGAAGGGRPALVFFALKIFGVFN